ncbi:MAG: AAA family ATPase [Acidobacteria bacterium]|nr:AAA family ATPase [Acidobacteriota bacterium]
MQEIQIGTTLGRYTIKSQLGRGGMAIVYSAVDTLLGREVAIKILLPSKDANSEIDRLVLQEAITASGLNHPNILTIYDVGQHNEYYYIAMELIPGQTLREKLNEAKLDPYEVIDIASQTAEGLGAAHNLGIIHRDVKPENLMIRPDGYVKVLDFGLAKICPGSLIDEAKGKSTLGRVGQLNTQRIMQGTVAYMSPEQVRGEDVDVRSDLFSLGIVIYEMLTGQLPFEAKTLADKMLAILRHEVIPPSHINKALTPEFDVFIAKALAKRKEDRFQNALALARALRLIEPGKSTNANTTWSLVQPIGQHAQTVAAAVENIEEDFAANQGFVGRAKELEQFQNRFQLALKGKPQLVLVTGESGMGKSVLVSQFHTQIKNNAAFLSGRFYENICGLPFVTFLDALSDFWTSSLLDNPTNLLGNIFAERTEQIEEALKKRDTVRASYMLLQMQGGAEQAMRSFEAIRRCLKALASHKPIVFFLDNLQWADDASLLAFAYLAKTLANVPILLVATIRTGELIEGSTLKTWAQQLHQRENVQVCHLIPFNLQEVGHFVSRLCPGIENTDELANALYQETDGNPYFVKEMVMLWLENGTLSKQKNGQWKFSDLEKLELPKSISDLIELKLKQLDKPILDVLSQASVIGNEFGFIFLQTVTQLDEEELIYILETAIRRSLIDEIGGQTEDRYIFHHNTIQQILYQNLSKRRKRQLHEKVAEALQKCFSGMIEKVTPQIAYHYRNAGVAEKTFEYSVRAAEQERQAGSASEQSNYLEWAKDALADMPTDIHDRKFLRLLSTYRLGLGSLASLRGRADVALSHLEEALMISQKVAEPQLHGSVLKEMGMLQLLLTDYPQAQKHFTEAIAIFERSGDTVQRLAALSGFTLSKSFNPKELEGAARWLMAVAGSSSQAKGFAYTALALADMQVGLLGQAIKHYQRALEHLEIAGETSQYTRTLGLLGTTYAQCRQFDLAEDCCHRGLEQSTNINLFAQLIARSTMIPIFLYRKEFSLAEETANQVLQLSKKSSNRLHVSRAHAELAEIYQYVGKFTEAITNYEQAIEFFASLNYHYRLAEALAKISLCYFSSNQIDKALEACRQARKISREHQFRYTLMIASSTMGRCFVAQNRVAEAKTYLREARHALEEMSANLPEDFVDVFLSDKSDILDLCNQYINR